jgi:hypothetical protein
VVYVLEGYGAFVVTAYDLRGRLCGVSPPQADVTSAMKKSELPPGWDETRVQETLDHYEHQTDKEAAAEHEAALSHPGHTLMRCSPSWCPPMKGQTSPTEAPIGLPCGPGTSTRCMTPFVSLASVSSGRR